jgi:hypothetical protein
MFLRVWIGILFSTVFPFNESFAIKGKQLMYYIVCGPLESGTSNSVSKITQQIKRKDPFKKNLSLKVQSKRWVNYVFMIFLVILEMFMILLFFEKVMMKL